MNIENQLSSQATVYYETPQIIPIPTNGNNTIQISAFDHTLVLIDNTDIYAFGDSEEGKIGNGVEYITPRYVAKPAYFPDINSIEEVQIGDTFWVLRTMKSIFYYGFVGYTRSFAERIEVFNDQWTELLLSSDFKDFQVKRISVGRHNALALLERHDKTTVISWGRINNNYQFLPPQEVEYCSNVSLIAAGRISAAVQIKGDYSLVSIFGQINKFISANGPYVIDSYYADDQKTVFQVLLNVTIRDIKISTFASSTLIFLQTNADILQVNLDGLWLRFSNAELCKYIPCDQVDKLELGGGFGLVQLRNGTLVGFGSTESHQFCIDYNSKPHPGIALTQFGRVQQFAAGFTHSVIVTENGSVVHCGNWDKTLGSAIKLELSLTNSTNSRVRLVAAGNLASFAIVETNYITEKPVASLLPGTTTTSTNGLRNQQRVQPYPRPHRRIHHSFGYWTIHCHLLLHEDARPFPRFPHLLLDSHPWSRRPH
jgi:hypothetical protein